MRYRTQRDPWDDVAGGWGCAFTVDNLEAMEDCNKKTRLAQEYESATTQFSEAVRELRRQMGTSPKVRARHETEIYAR